MKRKICILLSCIALILLVSCNTISPTEEKKEYSESYEETYEKVDIYEQKDHKEEMLISEEKDDKMNIQERENILYEENANIYKHEDNRNEISGEEENDSSLAIKKIFTFSNENSEILPLSIDREGKCFVDLNSYPRLNSAVELDQVKYAENIQDLRVDNEDVTVNTYIQRADDKVYSFLKIAFTGKDGEKKCINYEGLNYDVETGKLLLLEDIVRDQNKLIEVVKEQIESICREKSYSVESSAAVKAICDSDNKAWNIGYQGLVFYISINSQESENVEYIPVTVTFAKYPWLFWDNYMQVPKLYAVEVGVDSLFLYDMDGNGEDEEIKVWWEEKSNNHAIEKIYIQIGDREKIINCNEDNDLSEELVGSDLRCHILHLENSKNFLYIHTSTFMDNIEYSIVLDINASEIRIVNEGTWIVIEDRPLLDPQNIICKGGDILLSDLWDFDTISCRKIDQDGQFSKREAVEYYQSNGFGVKVISELMADEITLSDENILESSIELPIGTVLEPIRTNHETFVDFMDKNENLYRVEFEVSMNSEYEKMVTIQGNSAADYLAVQLVNK